MGIIEDEKRAKFQIFDEETFINHSEAEDETKDVSDAQSLSSKPDPEIFFNQNKFEKASLLIQDLMETLKNQKASPFLSLEYILKR